MHVERTLTLTPPVDQVFDYLADFTHTNEWDPGTVETRRTAGDGGVGTTYANTSEFMGRKVELTYETVTLEKPRQVRFRGKNKSATTMDTMTLTPADAGGTTLHYRADFDFGRLGNLVAPLLLRRKLEKLADETAEQLRRSLG